MRQSGDYVHVKSQTRFSDSEIESLLTRASTHSEEHEDLEVFIAALAAEASQPRDTYHMGTTLAAISRATAPTVRRGMRRLAALAATGAIFIALSGVALAADGSAPGEPLYRLDRALEAIGIGNGGFEERVEEFNVLVDRGDEEEAYEFMAEVIAEAGDSEAAPQQNVGPANDAAATRNQNVGEGPSESRSANRPEAPGQGNSQSPGNGNAPFTPADEAPPSNPNGQARGVGPDGETPNNPGQGSDNPGQGTENPGQDNPGQGTENPGQDNPGQDNPGQDNPGQDNPGQDNPGQGTENPGQDNPGQDNPGQDNLGQGTENPGAPDPGSPGQDNPGQDNPGQGNAGAGSGGSQGQGQAGSNPPDSAGQGNTGQGGPNQSSG